MSKMFINPKDEFYVEEDSGQTDAQGEPLYNRIYAKAKLGFEDNGKVEAALMKMRVTREGVANNASGDGPVDVDVTIAYSMRQLALLTVCITRWEGPDFRGVRCTPANIKMLDPSEPLIVQLLEEIDRRNSAETEAPLDMEPNDPNPQTPVTYDE